MATIEQLSGALVKADAAGNADDAKVFADAIRKMRLEPAAQAASAEQPNRSMLDQVRDFSVALGHHAANLPHGIAQLVENGVNSAAQQLPDNAVSRGINDVVTADNAAMAQREKDYQARVPNSAGAYSGAAVGEIAPFAANAVAKPLAAAGSLLERFIAKQGAPALAAKIGSGAAQGGIVGAAMPVTDGDYETSKLHQIKTGLALGGAAPLAAKIGSGAINLGRNIVNPILNPGTSAIEKLVQDAGGTEQAHAAIDRAVAAGNSMSGQPFTLGQAGKNAGLSATERARSAVNPENFQELYQAQRDARVAALQGIGGDDVAVQNALENRDLAANSLYGKAFNSDKNRVDLAQQELARKVSVATGGIAQRNNAVKAQLNPDLATDGLRELSQRPSFQTAIKQAQTLASNKGYDIGDPLQSLQGLHYVKLALDDMLNPQAASSMGRNASASIMDMRDKLAKELTDISPLYGNARSTYADMSAPINQMKVGQKLTDVLTGEAFKNGANAKQQAEQFFRALKNAPSIVKTETGLKQPLSKVFNENQLSSVKQVAQELAKDVDLQNLGKGVGSDTAQKLARGNAGNMLASVIKVIPYGEAGLKAGSALVKTRVNNQLDKLLQNPEQAKAALAKLSNGDKNKLMQFLQSNPISNQLINSSTNAP